jgi:hypothetical protein
MRKTWDKTIVKYGMAADESFRAGYRAGWIDHLADYRSIVCVTSHWGLYATGYCSGQIDCEQREK